MDFVGLAFVAIGCLGTVIALFSFMNIFGLVSKDERYQSHGTDQRVQKGNIKFLLIGLALIAAGFVIMLLAGG